MMTLFYVIILTILKNIKVCCHLSFNNAVSLVTEKQMATSRLILELPELEFTCKCGTYEDPDNSRI